MPPRDTANVCSHLRRWGLLVAAQYALGWRLRKWFGLHLNGIYTRPLIPPGIGLNVEGKGYAYRVFEPGDEHALLGFLDNSELRLEEAFVRNAFAKGDACGAVILGGRLISYSWMAFTPTRDTPGVYVEFGPQYRYGYKAFTLPQFRGRHVMRVFKAYGDDYCVRRGRELAIAFIATDNFSSIRASLGAGSQRIGFAGYWKLGPLFISFRTAQVRAAGFRFFKPWTGQVKVAPQPKPIDARS